MKGPEFIINGFPHGGKRATQALTFKQITHDFAGLEENTYLLYIDSDIALHPDSMIEFIKAMEKNKSLVGMTGFISAISSKKANFLWYFQDCEYVVGQIISRSLEAGLLFSLNLTDCRIGWGNMSAWSFNYDSHERNVSSC